MRVTAPGHAGEKKETLPFFCSLLLRPNGGKGDSKVAWATYLSLLCVRSLAWTAAFEPRAKRRRRREKGGRGKGGRSTFSTSNSCPRAAAKRRRGNGGSHPKNGGHLQKLAFLKIQSFFILFSPPKSRFWYFRVLCSLWNPIPSSAPPSMGSNRGRDGIIRAGVSDGGGPPHFPSLHTCESTCRKARHFQEKKRKERRKNWRFRNGAEKEREKTIFSPKTPFFCRKKWV